MSEEELKNKPTWWDRAKILVIVSQLIQAVVIVAAAMWGTGVVMENKISQIMSAPKRVTFLEKQDSVKFFQTDSSLKSHNGYFAVIFTKVDTNKRYTRR